MNLHAMTDPQTQLRQQRSRAVTTAWILAGIAAAIFSAFILSGVLAH
jgi:hypothetical protein